jgi:hypothetical protein
MLTFSLIACAGQELAQAWQVDRLRVLAVAAEPAEPKPGETVAFSALVVSPEVDVSAVIWTACSEAASSDYGCLSDTDSVEIIGYQPGLEPSWAVSEAFLDGLTGDEKLEGTNGLITVTAVPEGVDLEELDTGSLAMEAEIAYKRVPVSEAVTPNHNPGLLGILVDGIAVPAGVRSVVTAGATYQLSANLADDAVETYTYRTSEGVDETREEEPLFNYYLQEGMFEQDYALWPYTAVEWTAPASPERADQSLWLVVRDRRGGMAWAELPVRIEE